MNKPGPELDAFIAEKLMGWRLSARGNWWLGEDGADARSNQWVPSTNYENALQVVEFLRDKGWAYRIEGVPDISSARRGVRVTFQFGVLPPGHASSPMYEADGKDIPHAICLAAKLLTEVPKDTL